MIWYILAAVLVALVFWAIRRDRRREREADVALAQQSPRTPVPSQGAPVSADTTGLRIIDDDRPRMELPAVGSNDVVAFIDSETTGFSRDDRIVSLAIVTMEDGALIAADLRHSFDAAVTYLVFNPGRPSTKTATRVHGWTDADLARQPLFERHVDTVASRLASAKLWVMHNADFDLRFIRDEFERVGLTMPERPAFCTMKFARTHWPGETAKLDDCAARVGCRRANKAHGAAEDALLAAALYHYFRTGRAGFQIPDVGAPSNYVAA